MTCSPSCPVPTADPLWGLAQHPGELGVLVSAPHPAERRLRVVLGEQLRQIRARDVEPGLAGARNKLAGGKGNDCLVGGSRKDDLEAGAGDDTIIAKDGGRDTGSGGPGPDEGRFDPQDAIVSVAFRNFQGGC